MPEITVDIVLNQIELLPVVDQKRLIAELMQKLNGEAKSVLSDEEIFQNLADQWRKDTRHISSLSKMAVHPAYQRIIGMGMAVVPFILKELQQRGGHWLWALHAITGEDPAPVDANFPDAVQAWLEWGKQTGHLV